MDHVLEAAIYRRDGAMLQLLHGRMDFERSKVVRVIHGRRSLVGDGQSSNALEILHLFRIYYRARNRSQPALLEALCAMFSACLAEPYRNMETSHSVRLPYRLGHEQADSSLPLAWVAQFLVPLVDDAALEGGRSGRYMGSSAASELILYVWSVVQRCILPTLLISTSPRGPRIPASQRQLHFSNSPNLLPALLMSTSPRGYGVPPSARPMRISDSPDVLVYDSSTRRGWLVDGASVLLHLVRRYLSSSDAASRIAMLEKHEP